ncbi:MAG: hypothetical protein J5546_04485, partial [Lachnospiraceae bacterium]|nr:hypothetical protein [Lachnospiraceae bacterium]
RLLAGIFVMIGLAEGAHLAALVRGRSLLAFSKTYMLLLAIFVALSVVLTIVDFLWRKRGSAKKIEAEEARKEEARKGLEKKEIAALVAFLVLVLLQIGLIVARSAVFLEYDITLETVVSFIKTNALYSVDPLTGLPYAQGMPMRLKILCLPTLYAGVSQVFGVSPQALVWHLVPVITLIAAYLAYVSLARVLFSKNRFYAISFLVVAALVFFVGDYGYGMDGFGLLHGGFQGTTIRGAVLMPYLLGLCLRKKFRLLLLPVLVEACIVWTLYGLGMGVALIVCFFVIAFVRKRILDRKADGKEGTTWANS